MALIRGSYLGEVLKRHIGQEAEWLQETVFDDEEVLHLQVGEWRVFPIDKVYKRFVNGSEDNVISFYDITKEYMLKQRDLYIFEIKKASILDAFLFLCGYLRTVRLR